MTATVKIMKSACVLLLLLTKAKRSEEKTCNFHNHKSTPKDLDQPIIAALDAAKDIHDDSSRFCPAIEGLVHGIKKELEDTKEQLSRRSKAFMHC